MVGYLLGFTNGRLQHDQISEISCLSLLVEHVLCIQVTDPTCLEDVYIGILALMPFPLRHCREMVDAGMSRSTTEGQLRKAFLEFGQVTRG